MILDNAADAAADAAAFERAVSEAAGICVELAHRGFSVGLAVRGGEVRAAVGAAQAERILRALAVVAPDAGALPGIRAGTVVRIRPGAPPALETMGGARLHDTGAGMRFAAAHKLVTYLLVLAALAAVASTRVVAPASALLFLAACALSFLVEGGNRVGRRAGSRFAAGAPRRRRAVRRDRLARVAPPPRSRRRARLRSRVGPARLQAVLPAHPSRLHPDRGADVSARARRVDDRAQLRVRGDVRGLRRGRRVGADPVSPAPRDGRELPDQAFGAGAEPEGRRRAHPRIPTRRRRQLLRGDGGDGGAGAGRRGRDLHAGPARRRRVRGRGDAHVRQRQRLRRRDRDRALRNAGRPPSRCRAARDAARRRDRRAQDRHAPTVCTFAAPRTTATRAGAGSTATSRSCAPSSSATARGS